MYSAGGEFDIRQHYFELLSQDPSKSMPIAAIESLSALCDASRAGTIHELMSAIEGGAQALQGSIPNAISLTAGCELYKRFIIAHAHDDPKDFEAFKQQLQASGHLFAQRAREARAQVAAVGVGAIRDGATIFLHGHSRCVVGLLRKAAQDAHLRFTAIVTETRPSLLGLRTAKELRAAGIPVAVVDDNAMGYAIKKARLVLIGAEGVFGDGSILNIVPPPSPPLLRVADTTGNRWARTSWRWSPRRTTGPCTWPPRPTSLSTCSRSTSSTWWCARTSSTSIRRRASRAPRRRTSRALSTTCRASSSAASLPRPDC